MAYIITNDCIECGRCLAVCPANAIIQTETGYQIESDRCHNCTSYFTVPQCWSACPTNEGCVPDACALSCNLADKPASTYWETWVETYSQLVARLRSTQESPYWTRWFDAYSHELSKLLQTHSRLEVHA